ncbi:MAG: metal-dependent hydrolase [Thermodesulfobacteriota bacterium]
MFIGHFALGFAAKKITPQPSLGTLFLASQFIDLLWPILLLLGWEQVMIEPGNTQVTPLNFIHYPISHGLVAVILWGVLIGGLYFFIKRNLKSALVLGVLVVSHWILDWFTHRPDLPLFPGSDIKVGLGLWNSLIGTLIVEGGLFLFGVYLYLKATRAKNKTGHWALWILVVLLAIIYSANLFGPPPPEVKPIAYVGLLQWLFIAWGYWIDRNRKVT